MAKTVEQRIMGCLKGSEPMLAHGTRPLMTASDITRYVNYVTMFHPYERLPSVSLATVSSKLRKMVAAGKILRVADFGPREGYGYARRHHKTKGSRDGNR